MASFIFLQPRTISPLLPSPSFTLPPPMLCRRRIALRPAAHAGGDGGIFGLIRSMEAAVYTVADAAVSASSASVPAQAVVEEVKKGGNGGDWLSGITGYMETVLKVLKDGLSTLHVPYSYGFAIILLTFLVKAATFPLSKKQVESALAMRSLQPQVKAIQQRYAGDQERIQLEIARLYKLAGVNPLAGCLPTLATIPVWIGLYRALSNVADEGLLGEGFFWIPSLAGPTTIAARQSGGGISWLFPFKDGHPPLGWPDTLAYLVLPVLLIISQYISMQVMQPAQVDDPSQKSAQTITKFLPLLIGYFALSVPSGLSLYWLTNNILSTGQQVWLQKLGGAKNPVKEYLDRISRDESPTAEKDESEASTPPSNYHDELPKISKKSSSNEAQRGERFKRLREKEAKKKMPGVTYEWLSEKDSFTSVSNQSSYQDQSSVELMAGKNGSFGYSSDSGTDKRCINGDTQKEGESKVHGSPENKSSPDSLKTQPSESEGGEL